MVLYRPSVLSGNPLTYLLTPWCRVILEKLTGLQLVKKFTAFHGTRRFITALTSFRHLSLSWASPIQSTYPHSTSWRSILILSTHLHLGLPSGLIPSGFPTKTLYTPSSHPYAPHAPPIPFFSILKHVMYIYIILIWILKTVSNQSFTSSNHHHSHCKVPTTHSPSCPPTVLLAKLAAALS